MEEVQLICVGYAGSTAANFNILLPHFAGKVCFSAVEYRGRGTRSRRRERAGLVNNVGNAAGADTAGNEAGAGYADNADLVQDVAEQVKQLRKPELPYVILGYSMGAQVVYELFAQGLLTERPLCVFVAAHEPPDVPCAGKDIDLDDEEAFLERVKIYGGMDGRLLQDARFASIFLPRMRGDFRLLKEYVFSGVYHYFPARVVMLYCEEDTPYATVRGWQRFSEREVRFFPLGRSHFFFRTNAEEFCGIIMREIEESIQKQ